MNTGTNTPVRKSHRIVAVEKYYRNEVIPFFPPDHTTFCAPGELGMGVQNMQTGGWLYRGTRSEVRQGWEVDGSNAWTYVLDTPGEDWVGEYRCYPTDNPELVTAPWTNRPYVGPQTNALPSNPWLTSAVNVEFGWFRGKAVQGANCYHDAAITHDRLWRDGRVKFRAPMAYAPDQWAVLTFTGVQATTNETSLSLSNLTYKGQAPVACDTEARWVSYVVPMPGGSLQEFGAEDFGWPSTGEVHAWDTWEYGCSGAVLYTNQYVLSHRLHMGDFYNEVPTVLFSVISNPAVDNMATDLQIALVTSLTNATIVGAQFSTDPVENNPQNAVGNTSLSFIPKLGGDLTQWRVNEAIWYAWSNHLCHDEIARYRVQLTASVRIGDEVVSIKAPQTELRVKLPDRTEGTQIGGFSLGDGSVNSLSSDGQTWCVTVTLPAAGVFVKQSSAGTPDTSQYAPLIEREERHHHDHWMGLVGRPEGGCGDLFSNNAVEHYLSTTYPTTYDGKEIFCGYSSPEAAVAAAESRFTAARDYARLVSEQLAQDRRCYREKKSKEYAGYREAYLYNTCTYNSCAENPPNPDSEWRYDNP